MNMDHITNIKKAIEDKKIIIGTERTLKALKKDSLRTVYITANCPSEVSEDIAYYSKLAQVEAVHLEQPNDELGVLCRKSFSVSVVCVKA